MNIETWLKVGSVLVYLFVPSLILRLFFSFIEILFFIHVSDNIIITIDGVVTVITLLVGVILLFGDDYILKQKTK